MLDIPFIVGEFINAIHCMYMLPMHDIGGLSIVFFYTVLQVKWASNYRWFNDEVFLINVWIYIYFIISNVIWVLIFFNNTSLHCIYFINNIVSFIWLSNNWIKYGISRSTPLFMYDILSTDVGREENTLF